MHSSIFKKKLYWNKKRVLFFVDIEPKYVVNSSVKMGRCVPEKSSFSRKIQFFPKYLCPRSREDALA
jgi:hypothetical protein